jgi:hypothetical protein
MILDSGLPRTREQDLDSDADENFGVVIAKRRGLTFTVVHGSS